MKLQQRDHGFTLIELMISITILSLLLFTGTYSYSMMAERWNKELGQFSKLQKNAKHLSVLQGVLEGVNSLVVIDNEKEPSFFFIGGEDSLLAVSRSGLFSNEYPEIFRLTSVNKENGLIDLVYQSLSTENFLLLGTEQEINFEKKLILFKNLDKVNFSYLGWPSLTHKINASENKTKQQWFSHYSGIDNQLMPQQLSVTLTKRGKSLTIPIILEQKPERWLRYYREEE